MKKPAFKATKKHKEEKIENAINLLNEIVKIKVGPSKIQGVGIFAMRDLKEGEKLNADAIFQYLDVPYKEFKKLRKEVAQHIIERWPNIMNGSHFVYPDAKMTAFMNHSDYPNYDNITDTMKCKVYAGEEITEDYRNINGWEKIYPWIQPRPQKTEQLKSKSVNKSGKRVKNVI